MKLDRGSTHLGVTPAGRDDEPVLPSPIDVEDPRSSFFTDGRDGIDRWGRDLRTVTACGTGWGPGEYVCPLYVEESCPGARNRGDRTKPEITTVCDLDCGGCGGGGRAHTMGYCGQQRGSENMRAAMAEMGGSLRLDKWMAPPATPLDGWPAAYFPVVEHYAKNWRHILADLPMIGTTMQSVYGGRRKAKPVLLRERLGGKAGYDGKLCVTGLVKDDLLDDVWDDLEHVLKYLRASDVDCVVAPQYSYYDENANGMAVYNANRIFAYYTRCMELGFPTVALDVPPFAAEWLHYEFIDFIVRSDVKVIAGSYQTFGTRGALDPRHVLGARRLHASLPPDVSMMVFGVGQRVGQAQLARLMPGRHLVFADKAPYALAIFFTLLPHGTNAPPGMKKDEVFARNVAVMTKQVEHATRRKAKR